MRFIWPLDNHYITRGFGFKAAIYIGGQHAAVDLVRLQGDTAGREIKAAAAGVVVVDAQDSISGHHIALEHEDGWRTMYRHLEMDAPPVVGQHVAQGEVIGNVGSTGLSTGPHLHFDLWHRQNQDDTAFQKGSWWAHNPELYLGQEDTMTPEQEQLLAQLQHDFPILLEQVSGLLKAEADFRIVQGQVQGIIEQHQAIESEPGKHGSTGGAGYTDADARRAVKERL